MVNKNYRRGSSFESRFIANLLKNGDSVKGGRFFASKGITDVWWVDIEGVHNEAQLKFSSKKNPYISPKELEELKEIMHETKLLIDELVKERDRIKQLFKV